MPFSMLNSIDRNFSTHRIKIKCLAGTYENGLWKESTQAIEEYNACIQPLSPQEFQTLDQGGRRLIDVKKVYLDLKNNSFASILPSSLIAIVNKKTPSDNNPDDNPDDKPKEEDVFDYQIIKADLRPEREYFKIIIAKVDQW